ncbi:MAG TPA: class I SAM-dependent methyltransferase [Gemmatimonadaceae bacterium]|nr:class I SAM-dependent methyltransferase [Gemmatimonadaceae bacterium]
MASSATPEYVLGHASSELQRLAYQAQYWGEATLEWLRRAAIEPGMRLLDIGCGAGDVSLLAATLVGPTGSVLGVDRSPDAVATATQRATAMGLSQVQFEVASLETFAPDRQFDGIIGRLVLIYLADPVAELRKLLRFVRQGGVVAFFEMDMVACRSVPPVPLVEESMERLRQTFRRAGNTLDLGPRLWRVFRDAGLPDASMMVHWRAEPAPAAPGARLISETTRSLLPMMERFGVARAAEVDVDTLSSRLQAAVVAQDATLLPPAVVGAWARR